MENKIVLFKNKWKSLPERDQEKIQVHKEIRDLVLAHKEKYPKIPIYMKMWFGYDNNKYPATCKVLGYAEAEYVSPTLFMDNNPLWEVFSSAFDAEGDDVHNLRILDEDYQGTSTDHIDYNRMYDHVEEVYFQPTDTVHMVNREAKISLSVLEEM